MVKRLGFGATEIDSTQIRFLPGLDTADEVLLAKGFRTVDGDHLQGLKCVHDLCIAGNSLGQQGRCLGFAQ